MGFKCENLGIAYFMGKFIKMCHHEKLNNILQKSLHRIVDIYIFKQLCQIWRQSDKTVLVKKKKKTAHKD